ncbi:uncharacterized protein LOC110007522 isoform X2 [Amborella trichopoda]|uniref:uncharacterized protein LOC110007522 isoform X2 n=1 Tax=Amborella trichopoda TaxID=13333 RepID=UPI0009C191D5|nr:uncharacterized protein LOC110007522 isoform X2 [Amborella trichopoda]|eukprot:XP_020524622.1 uncharacterized protein LOC110007522 isoform X2 [Amborella trichopoda]
MYLSVFTKERNCRRGQFCPNKLMGERAIELGAGRGLAGFASMSSIQVAELDWGNSHQIAAVDPPFDYAISTNIVYPEHLLDPPVATLNALFGPKTTILGYELRSTNVHEKMMNMWKTNYEVKSIPKSKTNPKYIW